MAQLPRPWAVPPPMRGGFVDADADDDALVDVADRARRPAADVPGGRNFIALLEAFRGSGGTAPAEVLGPLIESHRQGQAVSLAKLVFTGQVFGFDWRGSLWVPMFQFDAADLSPLQSAQQVRAALPALWPQWTVAAWCAGANARLDGCRPADRLDTDPAAVLAAARALQQRGRDHALVHPAGAAPRDCRVAA